MTKSLEDIKREAREELVKKFPPLKDGTVVLDYNEFLDRHESNITKAYLAALDACREKVQELDNAGGYQDDPQAVFMDTYSAIDSLRTVGGKE